MQFVYKTKSVSNPQFTFNLQSCFVIFFFVNKPFASPHYLKIPKIASTFSFAAWGGHISILQYWNVFLKKMHIPLWMNVAESGVLPFAGAHCAVHFAFCLIYFRSSVHLAGIGAPLSLLREFGRTLELKYIIFITLSTSLWLLSMVSLAFLSLDWMWEAVAFWNLKLKATNGFSC